MTNSSLWLAVLIAAVSFGIERLHRGNAPETFHASAQMKGPLGMIGVTMDIHIDRYLSNPDRAGMLAALRSGGAESFSRALKSAPAAGYLEVGDRRWTIRWAHEEERDLGRVIVLATDEPVYFFETGGHAKSRAGYTAAVIRLDVDVIGTGAGTMYAAAMVRPTEDGSGVKVDDYADQPLQLVMVTKDYSSSLRI